MLHFVGIGPGDPELLTLKAVHLLQKADAIAFADTGTGSSAVEEILGDLIQGKPLYPLHIPMRGDRAQWIDAHRRAADQLLEMLRQYADVVYPVLGDPGIYASSSYLMRLVQKSHLCRVVPGITAMCAAAAELGIPLCEQGESLTILDHFDPEAPLPDGNVIVMKGGRHLQQLKQRLQMREAYAVRNLGMQNEWKGALEHIPEEDYSYFTTVIAKTEKTQPGKD